jgi:hypothetical protein
MEWATKENFFKCPVPKERVTASELGDVWVHGLTAGEKDSYENDVVSFKARTRELRMTNARAVLMQLTIYNQHGVRLFGEKDIGRLCRVPAMIADPILDVARRLSGMATDELKDLVKNSEALEAGSDGSDSASQQSSDVPRPA